MPDVACYPTLSGDIEAHWRLRSPPEQGAPLERNRLEC